jgi:hypothetical protein
MNVIPSNQPSQDRGRELMAVGVRTGNKTYPMSALATVPRIPRKIHTRAVAIVEGTLTAAPAFVAASTSSTLHRGSACTPYLGIAGTEDELTRLSHRPQL